MSQSSESRISHSQPLLQKIVVALAVVLVGHVGVLWALSQMKAPELKPIEKKPIKVKLIKIEEEILPPPPPPPPVQPKVKPKPQPVVPPPPPVVKPKIIAQKPAPAKENVIHQDDTLVKQKLLDQQRKANEQRRLDDQRRADEQRRLEDQRRADEQRRLEDQRRADEKRRKDEEDKRNRDLENQKPQRISPGDIKWSRTPKPAYTKSELLGEERSILLEITSDAKGNITSVRLKKSTGITALDNKFISAIKSGKFKPYMRNGVATPFVVDQPYNLSPKEK